MGRESKGLSAEVSQSAAAGLLWLSEGKGDHRGNVAGGGGALSRFLTQLNGNLSLIHYCLLDRQEFQCRNMQLHVVENRYPVL